MTLDMLQLMREAAAAAGVKPREFVLPNDHYVTVNGLRLHYLDWGNANLPPVLLLHGVRLQAHTWDMSALLLRDHYHLIAVDQRGHGDSEWTSDAQFDDDTFDLMLEDTQRLVEHLGWKKFILVGMSMGGITAMRYAAKFPDRLLALCIVDIAPTTMNAGVLSMEGFKIETETLSRFEDFLERSHKFMPHRPIAQLRYSLMHSLKQLPDGRWTWKQDHRPGAVHRKAPLIDLWNELPKITAPTLLMRGAQSNVLAADVAERAAASFLRGKLVAIDPATHNVHSDNPNAFARELHSFLQSVL
ncbi:MAG TPA: alpha/beta hydrolase [Steroidobacteraceae bacterium]|nr:alpha/beta hydrolase [Steroidobacteraceae bacterium]